MVFITLQGFPTATTFGGISLFTILPAPITTLSPIVTPGSTITFPPIHTLFPTFIGFAYSNPLFLLSAFKECLFVFYIFIKKASLRVPIKFKF